LTSSAALLLLAVGFATYRFHPPVTPRVTEVALPARPYEIISDAELLMALRDRPIAVVKRNDGSNEFVLIGEDSAVPVNFE
jgi:hypothetical protein